MEGKVACAFGDGTLDEIDCVVHRQHQQPHLRVVAVNFRDCRDAVDFRDGNVMTGSGFRLSTSTIRIGFDTAAAFIIFLVLACCLEYCPNCDAPPATGADAQATPGQLGEFDHAVKADIAPVGLPVHQPVLIKAYQAGSRAVVADTGAAPYEVTSKEIE